ncbi:hypothetical protein TrLO_g7217 [Triparma laevis f. longispina]|nr:hypothetical protein TrLO_g7217 [Triparma laevis f. longispina]
MQTPEFYRHFLDYVPVCTLMSMRLLNKELRVITEQFVLAGKRRGAFIVHDGRDGDPNASIEAMSEMHQNVTRVIFLLNITNVGEFACCFAVNLGIVDVPEGVEIIGYSAFYGCNGLTTVSFPTTLTSIGVCTFLNCSSLDNVDLLHTNLQELGRFAFDNCSELKSMTIPDSLQTIGADVFINCAKLVPSNIDIDDEINEDDVTPEVVDLLRERSRFAALKMQLSEQSVMFETKIKEQSVTFTASISTLSAQNESLHASIASLKQCLQTLHPPPPTTTKRKHSSSS